MILPTDSNVSSSFFVSIFFGMCVQSIMDMCSELSSHTNVLACLVGKEHVTKPWDHRQGRPAHNWTLLAKWQGCALAKHGGPWHSTFALRWLGNLSFSININLDQDRLRAWGDPSIFLEAQSWMVLKKYMYNHTVSTYQTAWVEEHARPPAG